jgi:D-glycero-D-manno-heptose 1,7-bisphosphate phosphatase
MSRLLAHFESRNAWLQLTAYGNRDHYTRSNLRVCDDGLVECYDPSRTAPDLGAVDLGYMIVDRRAVDLIPRENVSFQKAVFPALVERRKLTAYVTDHRYYSIGSRPRLPEAERFFTGPKTVLLDRDGVLNDRPGPARYVTSEEDWRWRPGAKEALRRLEEANVRTVLVTNQPGIARGKMTRADLDRVHERMRREAQAAGGDIDHIYACLHGWNDGCGCRKPAPGMLLAAQRDLALDLMQTPFIGDDERDRQAAEAAGCPFYLVDEHTSLLDIVERLLSSEASEGKRWASGS